MAGIYIHIPFCSSKCHYCNFYSTVSHKYSKDFLVALQEEIWLTRNYLENEEISTIYFGGGTPTTYDAAILEDIIEMVRNHHAVAKNIEITIEANPDDLSDSYLESLTKTSINRLSIGTQAFDDEILKRLNRRHTANQSLEAILNAQKHGFKNLSIDLIYAIPGLENTSWTDNLHMVTNLNPMHISAYHLTVEEGTALSSLISKKAYPTIDEEIGMEQFDIMEKVLISKGFEHYEISNFAKPGFRSMHNSNYWKGVKYLGLGPSAHSFNQVSRQWNVSNIKQYVESLKNGQMNFLVETLGQNDFYNEFIMLGFRTMEGVSIHEIEKRFGSSKSQAFMELANKFVEKSLMISEDGWFRLTSKGKKLADGISSDFFLE